MSIVPHDLIPDSTNDPTINLQVLSKSIGVEESLINTLNPTLLNKLSDIVSNLELLKSENLDKTSVIDGLKSSFQQKIEKLKEEFKTLSDDNDKLINEKESFEKSKRGLEETIQKNSAEIKVLELKSTELLEQKKMVESDKTQLLTNLEKKSFHINDLVGQVNALETKVKDLKTNKNENELRIQNLESDNIQFKFENEKLKKELELSSTNNNWLNEQLKITSEKFNEYRQNISSELLELKSSLRKTTENLQLEKNCNARITKDVEHKTELLQQKSVELKTISDNLEKQKQEFAHEVMLKEKLIALLEKQIKTLKETHADHHDQTVAPKDSLIEELSKSKEIIKNYEAKIVCLEDELQQLSTIDSTQEEKSIDIGKVYSDMNILKKELIKERHQKLDLQKQVESFIVELEHKVPILNTFKERTEMLENEITVLTFELEKTSKDNEMKIRLLDCGEQKINDYQSQIKLLKQQRIDLANQVKYLLLQIELRSDTKQANILTPKQLNLISKLVDSSNPYDEDIQKEISDRLVVFKDIDELQKHNAELLTSLRQLGHKLEEEEMKNATNISSIESKAIEEAKELIIELQKQNTTLQDKLALVIKERDAYKLVNSSKTSDGKSTEADVKSIISENQARIKELENHLSESVKYYSENVKVLNEEVQALYKQKSEIELKFSSERSSKLLAEERYRLLCDNLDGLKSENTLLRSRCDKIEDNILTQDKNTNETINELISLKSQNDVLLAQIENLKKEKSLIKESNDKRSQENASISKERNQLKVLVTELQMLKKENDKILENAYKKYSTDIEQTKAEITSLKTQLETKTKELDDLSKLHRDSTDLFQQKIFELNEKSIEFQKDLATKDIYSNKLEGEIKTLKDTVSQKDSKLHTYGLLNENSPLEMLKKEMEKTEIKLREYEQELSQYKDMYKSSEETITNLSSALQLARDSVSQKEQEFVQLENELKHKISLLETQITDLNNELEQQKLEKEIQLSDYKKEIERLKVFESDSASIRKDYEDKTSLLQNSLSEQQGLAISWQKKYEEELQNHASITKSVGNLREDCQRYQKQVEELKATADTARKTLETHELSWEEQRAELESQLGLANESIEDLKSQNKLLYDQIENKLELNKGLDSVDEELFGNKELLFAVRREKEILETKLEVSKREESLTRQQLDSANKELLTCRMELNNLKHLSDSNTNEDLFNKHNEILEKLNQLNLLKESNITLRNELTLELKKNKDWSERIQSLEAELSPLRVEIETLKTTISEKTKELESVREEANRWKTRIQDMSKKYGQVDVTEYENLKRQLATEEDEIKRMKTCLEETKNSYEDKFQKLKSQCHIKLNDMKIKNQTSLDELNLLLGEKIKHAENLEKEKNELTLSFETERKKLEVQLSETTEQIKSADNLSKKVEELEQKLNKERDYSSKKLAELSVQKDVNDFEKQKQQWIEEKEKELTEKFKEDLNKAIDEKLKELSAEKPPSATDIERLKKEWEAENEKVIEERINKAKREAVEGIKEERIDSIIKKKQKSLEESFNKKVMEEAEKLTAAKKEVDQTEIRKQLELELKEKLSKDFSEKLNESKKKQVLEAEAQFKMKINLLKNQSDKYKKEVEELKQKLGANDKAATHPFASPAALPLPSGASFPFFYNQLGPNGNNNGNGTNGVINRPTDHNGVQPVFNDSLKRQQPSTDYTQNSEQNNDKRQKVESEESKLSYTPNTMDTNNLSSASQKDHDEKNDVNS